MCWGYSCWSPSSGWRCTRCGIGLLVSTPRPEPLVDRTGNKRNKYEQGWYDGFVKHEGRAPDGYLELMIWSANQQAMNKEERIYWSGVLGL
jgi:hypothetical protein